MEIARLVEVEAQGRPADVTSVADEPSRGQIAVDGKEGAVLRPVGVGLAVGAGHRPGPAALLGERLCVEPPPAPNTGRRLSAGSSCTEPRPGVLGEAGGVLRAAPLPARLRLVSVTISGAAGRTASVGEVRSARSAAARAPSSRPAAAASTRPSPLPSTTVTAGRRPGPGRWAGGRRRARWRPAARLPPADRELSAHSSSMVSDGTLGCGGPKVKGAPRPGGRPGTPPRRPAGAGRR